jgi:hypothetical protein
VARLLSGRLADATGTALGDAEYLLVPDPLVAAVRGGSVAVLERLLAAEAKRTPPAREWGHTVGMDTYEEPRRAPRLTGFTGAIRAAAEHSQLAALDRLLADARAGDQAVASALEGAARGRNAPLTAWLLRATSAPSPYGRNARLLWAVDARVLDVLLADPHLDPSTDENEVLTRVLENGWHASVDRLLADPRVVATVPGSPPRAARRGVGAPPAGRHGLGGVRVSAASALAGDGSCRPPSPAPRDGAPPLPSPPPPPNLPSQHVATSAPAPCVQAT